MTYIPLGYNDLILPALLVVMNGALSLALQLKLERQLALASVRMVVQLVLVGYVLTFLLPCPVLDCARGLHHGSVRIARDRRSSGDVCRVFGPTAWAQAAPYWPPAPSRCFHFSPSFVLTPGIIHAMLCRCWE